MLEPPAFPTRSVELRGRIELPLPTYQVGVLTVERAEQCGGTAGIRNLHLERCHRFSKPRRAPTRLRVPEWRKADVSIAIPREVPSRFERAPGAVPIDLPTGGERVRTMPTPCGANRFQNGACALTGSLSKLADRKRVELSTISGRSRIPNGVRRLPKIRSKNGTPGPIRTDTA